MCLWVSIFDFVHFAPPTPERLVPQQSDIAIMSGASVLGGFIGFGPSSFNLLGKYFEIKEKVDVHYKAHTTQLAIICNSNLNRKPNN